MMYWTRRNVCEDRTPNGENTGKTPGVSTRSVISPACTPHDIRDNRLIEAPLEKQPSIRRTQATFDSSGPDCPIIAAKSEMGAQRFTVKNTPHCTFAIIADVAASSLVVTGRRIHVVGNTPDEIDAAETTVHAASDTRRAGVRSTTDSHGRQEAA